MHHALERGGRGAPEPAPTHRDLPRRGQFPVKHRVPPLRQPAALGDVTAQIGDVIVAEPGGSGGGRHREGAAAVGRRQHPQAASGATPGQVSSRGHRSPTRVRCQGALCENRGESGCQQRTRSDQRSQTAEDKTKRARFILRARDVTRRSAYSLLCRVPAAQLEKRFCDFVHKFNFEASAAKLVASGLGIPAVSMHHDRRVDFNSSAGIDITEAIAPDEGDGESRLPQDIKMEQKFSHAGMETL